VAARQELRRLPRRVEGFQADRAIRESRIGRTRVRLQGGGKDARAALVAMRMGVFTSHAANPTLVAVVLTLVHVVQEDADGAPIEAQGDAAGGAGLSCVLYRIAPHTLDGFHGFSVQLVGLLGIRVLIIHCGVVAEAAAKECVAARGEQGCLAFVVFAAFVGSVH